MRKLLQMKKGEKWEMIRWLNKFIQENKKHWEKERKKIIKEEEMNLSKWGEMQRHEKIKEIKKRRDAAQETPKIEKPETWWWREMKDQSDDEEETTLHSLPLRHEPLEKMMKEPEQTIKDEVHDAREPDQVPPHDVLNPQVPQEVP